ncbi:MAG: oxidoreductase-like domain-containing protein [Luteimonas sp.]
MHDDDPPLLPPREPDPADCCGEGCVNCIHDIHDAALARYRHALAEWLPPAGVARAVMAGIDRR